MTSPAFSSIPRVAPAALAALILTACGGDGDGTATAASASGTSTGSASAPTTASEPTDTSAGSQSATEPTSAGSVSMTGETGDTSATSATGTAPGTDTTDPGTDTTNTTPPETTNPVDTGTDDSTSSSTTVDPDTGTTVDPDTTNGSSSGGDSTTGDPVVPCACPDLEVPLDDGIFVLSDNAQLWKFYPESLNFQQLGSFICNGQTATFSMSVDRLGFAWVMFSNGDIYKVDVTDPTNCTDPGYTPNQGGANLFGMGFVSNSAVDQCDSLFGNTFSGFGFSEGPGQGTFLNMNPDTLLVSKLGPTTFNGAEVTGTGDGRVFIFGGVNPAKIVEVDRTNGAYLDVFPVTGIETTQGFAFAFFAGDFYIFTESDQLNDAVSKVTHVDYDDSDMNGQKDITKVVPQAPIRIVGAGVSTCAPFLPQ